MLVGLAGVNVLALADVIGEPLQCILRPRERRLPCPGIDGTPVRWRVDITTDYV